MQSSSRIVLASLTALALCASPLAAQGNGSAGRPGPGGAAGGGTTSLLGTYIDALPLETVDATERALLIQMRQEEKLARDVYRTLYQTWGIPAFDKIAQSEQQHMDLVKSMLDRYGIADPVTSNRVGAFGDPFFAALYDLLVGLGSVSELYAEVVGAVIEDLDIADLNHAIALTDNRDIDTVWQNLNRGSRNHMRAFYRLLDARGLVYPGYFLSSAEIQAIVTTPVETAPVDETGAPLR